MILGGFMGGFKMEQNVSLLSNRFEWFIRAVTCAYKLYAHSAKSKLALKFIWDTDEENTANNVNKMLTISI